jgi:DNA-directed RNA polymerase alpha subunit
MPVPVITDAEPSNVRRLRAEGKLSTRASNALFNSGIYDLAELDGRLTEFLAISGGSAGPKTVLEIAAVMTELGLRLGMLDRKHPRVRIVRRDSKWRMTLARFDESSDRG